MFLQTKLGRLLNCFATISKFIEIYHQMFWFFSCLIIMGVMLLICNIKREIMCSSSMCVSYSSYRKMSQEDKEFVLKTWDGGTSVVRLSSTADTSAFFDRTEVRWEQWQRPPFTTGSWTTDCSTEFPAYAHRPKHF